MDHEGDRGAVQRGARDGGLVRRERASRNDRSRGSYPDEQAWLTYEKTRRVRDPDLLQEVMDLLVEVTQSIEEYVWSVVGDCVVEGATA